MKENIEFVGENMAVLHGSGTVVSLLEATAKAPIIAYTTPDREGATIQNWGTNNLQPMEQRQKLEKTTTAFPLISKSATTLFGRGITYYREVRTQEGIMKDYSSISEVDEFIQGNDLEIIMLERWMDLKVYNNLFCEFLFNGAGTRIVKLAHQEAEFCRFGEIENNKIKHVLINSNWQSNGQDYVSVPFYDDYYMNVEEAIKLGKSKKKFVTHNNIPSPGRTLYAVPSHIGLFENQGWLDYSISVPKLMNLINKNGFLLKYHIEIPSNYWSSVYKDWETKTEAKKKELMQEKMDEMDAFLKSTENAGKNFYSHFGIHQATGKEISGWKITELKDPIKKDQFLTSLQESDMQTARAIGVDVSLANISSKSNSMGAGSGSDKRVGMDNTIAASYAEQMIVLKPLKVVGMVNGWPKNLKWTFEYEVPTTLNENKSGTKIVS
jgi:hypothetical protein